MGIDVLVQPLAMLWAGLPPAGWKLRTVMPGNVVVLARAIRKAEERQLPIVLRE